MRRKNVGAVFVLATALVALSIGPLRAQQGVVTGTVRSGAGQPLSDVTVQVVGEDIGVLTDAEGQYRLEIAAGSYRLRASLIGFGTASQQVTVTAGEEVQVNLMLAARAIEMESLVASVTAREARRVELGTDISRIDAEDAVEKSGATSFSDLLNARSTGVSVSQSSGEAGTGSRIRIRGATSITQDNNPIIYIDGVRASNASATGPGSFDFANGQTISRLDDIPPSDIASIQVLKGPTAAALYGSEAASGVILIETKSGSGLESQVSYRHRQGVTNDVTDYYASWMSLAPFGITDPGDPSVSQWRTIQNPVTNEVFLGFAPLENPVTNPFRTGRSVHNSVNVRGSTEGFSYYSSLRHETEEGVFRNNGLERSSMRANFQGQLYETLDVSVNTSYINSRVRIPDNDRSAVGMIGNGLLAFPIFSYGVASDGSRGECLATVLQGAPSSTCAPTEGNITASFPKLETIRNTQDIERFIASANANWEPFDWLNTRAVLGVDFTESVNVNLVPLDPDRPFGSNSDGLREEERNADRIFTLDLAATGSWPLLEGIQATSTVGAQVFRQERELTGCGTQGGFASPSATACDAALTFTGFSDLVQIREIGGFFQQQFSYNDYLFATGAVRVDDNSGFGAEQDVIYSPSVNASALLSAMPFWEVEDVSNLRLRLAWGKAAQAPDPFAEARTFEPIRVSQGGSQQIGVQPKDPGNPNLTAERNEEFEFGFDAGFFQDRIGLQVTYYDQQTTDAIIPTDVAPSTGFTGTQFVNIGAIENSGFELGLNAEVLSSDDVRLEANFTHSTQDPVITDLGDTPPILFGLGADHQMFREGFSPGHLWAWEIASADRDADGNIVPGSVNLAPGNVGDPDRPNDRALGKAFPGNQQSLSATLTLFDRIRVFTLLDRGGDFMKFDETQEFRTPFIPGSSTSRMWVMRQAESTPEEQAAMEFPQEFTTNGLFIQDGTYVKWREVSLRYDLPPSVLDYLGIVDGAAVTVGGRNLATMTDYSGFDPELSYDGGSDSFNAADFLTQPPGRSFYASVALTF